MLHEPVDPKVPVRVRVPGAGTAPATLHWRDPARPWEGVSLAIEGRDVAVSPASEIPEWGVRAFELELEPDPAREPVPEPTVPEPTETEEREVAAELLKAWERQSKRARDTDAYLSESQEREDGTVEVGQRA